MRLCSSYDGASLERLNCQSSPKTLTAGRGDDGLQLPLFASGGQRERHGQHGAEGGAHVQAGRQGAVALADVGVAEVEGGDGLARLLVDAGDAGGARAAEGVVPVV